MEFLRVMKFRVENPRADKLLVRRARLLVQLEEQPWEIDRLMLRGFRIEEELERLGIPLKKQCWYLGIKKSDDLVSLPIGSPLLRG